MEPSSNRIRSTFSKPLLIFLLVIFFSTLGFGLALILVDFTPAFRVIGLIFCISFFILSGILLFDALFHFEVVEGDEIAEVVAWVVKKAKISEISAIVSTPGYYTVYVKDAKFCTLNAQDPSTAKMLYQFERHGFDLARIKKVEDPRAK